MKTTQKASVIDFPCAFPIKIIGLATDTFEIEALTILKKHVTDLKETAIQLRRSKEGRYLAITVTITAESQQQLDAIYADLSASEQVLMAL